MKVINEEEYNSWKSKNTDNYGKAIFDFAERWVDLMEPHLDCEMDKRKYISENASQLSCTADTEGITGFMYGMAVSILSECWLYGEELRKWHNKEYDYDGDGVVNPAILTIRGDNE